MFQYIPPNPLFFPAKVGTFHRLLSSNWRRNMFYFIALSAHHPAMGIEKGGLGRRTLLGGEGGGHFNSSVSAFPFHQGAFKFLKGQSRDIFLLQIFYQTTHGLIDLPRSDSDILFCKIFVKLFEIEISKIDSPLEVRSKKMLLEVTQFFSAFKSS
jgi:hypothetical protein